MHARLGLETDIGIGMLSVSTVHVLLLVCWCEGSAQKKAEEEAWASVREGSAG